MYLEESYNTERLHLRRPQISDAPQIFDSYAQDEDVCRYMTWLPYEDLRAYEDWLSDKIASIGKKVQTYVICHVDNKSRVIGMLDATIKGHKAEVGYALAKEEWGKGYMTEAVSKLLEALLAEPDIYRVSAVCDLENLGSSRVMEKSGMTYEGILRCYIIHPCISNEPRDVKCYSKTL